ncbi:hypothetical protein ACFQZS_01780 [Mucilaginibacter calamicampi]|uniref:Uncharacterized protein n=1 Tax=Mucilaginibacter calamicampi TaxID=1302352 RepID=A0ABW2YR33_9SPHI
MKNLSLCFTIVFCWIFLQACKKGNEVVLDTNTPKPVSAVYKDSVSFTVNQTNYVFNDRFGFGSGNYAINIKRSEVKIPGGKLASETGNAYWYGVPDSTLYAASYTLNSNPYGDQFQIAFTKKFKDSDLVRKGTLLYLQNHGQLFKTGETGFAADLDKENTMEGVAIELYDRKLNSSLISKIPGFSIIVRSNLKKDIQNNSHFVVTKVEKTKEGQYLIEAKFDLNLFDENGKLYKLENGFLRLKAPVLYN